MGKKQHHRFPVSSKMRRHVIARDGKECRYCGRTDLKRDRDFEGTAQFLTLDHVQPTSHRGKNTVANLVVCCYGCNIRKGDLTLVDLGWALLPPKLSQMPEWRRRQVGWTDAVVRKQRHRITTTSLKGRTLARTH